jgi:hypothetical protein
VSRPALALTVLLITTACAPAADAPHIVEVHGVLERTAALTGLEGWLLTTDEGPLLAVTVPDDLNPTDRSSCFRIAVPDDFDDTEVVAGLQALQEESGDNLEITGVCA